ncbi:hypothetical protein K1X76_12740 [bacterium]|nr:hypothetical protein [bacterium]
MKHFLLSTIFALAPFVTYAQTITPGMKAADVTALKGQPYYQTSHYSHKPDDQVWLYTKAESNKKVDEKQITDTQTNWPTLYRKTVERTCQVGDVFVEVTNGVVKNVIPANNKMSYGPCSITTTEEYLPIVNGAPSNTPSRTVNNTELDGGTPFK